MEVHAGAFLSMNCGHSCPGVQVCVHVGVHVCVDVCIDLQVEANKDRSLTRRAQGLQRFVCEQLCREAGAAGRAAAVEDVYALRLKQISQCLSRQRPEQVRAGVCVGGPAACQWEGGTALRAFPAWSKWHLPAVGVCAPPQSMAKHVPRCLMLLRPFVGAGEGRARFPSGAAVPTRQGEAACSSSHR